MNLSELTTIRVGGPAAAVVEPATPGELVSTARELWRSGEEVLLVGGGSNLVVSDAGYEGTVIRVVTRGIAVAQAGANVRLTVQAGERWDDLVAATVTQGLAGIEALSGIPGSVGAAPIQNIGAYGQELSSTLVSVEFLDAITGEVTVVSAADLELGYRTSAIKRGRQGLVVSVVLELVPTAESPVAYEQLASALGVSVGTSVPLARVRESVLALRASKGMVLDAGDPDSVSAGSFFTNPIVTESFARGLPGDVPRWAVEEEDDTPTVVPLEHFIGDVRARPQTIGERGTKLSAAWLIEHSGIGKGFRLPGSAAAVSSKHTLAIVNTGYATAEDVAQLARYIQARVLTEFGVILQPEPVLVGIEA